MIMKQEEELKKYKEIVSREQKFNTEWEKKDQRKHKCCEHATMVN